MVTTADAMIGKMASISKKMVSTISTTTVTMTEQDVYNLMTEPRMEQETITMEAIYVIVMNILHIHTLLTIQIKYGDFMACPAHSWASHSDCMRLTLTVMKETKVAAMPAMVEMTTTSRVDRRAAPAKTPLIPISLHSKNAVAKQLVGTPSPTTSETSWPTCGDKTAQLHSHLSGLKAVSAPQVSDISWLMKLRMNRVLRQPCNSSWDLGLLHLL